MTEKRKPNTLDDCIIILEQQIKSKSDYVVLWSEAWIKWGKKIIEVGAWLESAGYKLRKQIPENPNGMFAIVAERIAEISSSSDDELKNDDDRSVRRDACLAGLVGQMEGSYANLEVKIKDWQQFSADIIDLLNHAEAKRMGYSLRKEFCQVIKTDGVNYLVIAEKYLDLKEEDLGYASANLPVKVSEHPSHEERIALKDGKPIQSSFICPICGYPELTQEPVWSYETCSCCGATFGENDGETPGERFLRRQEWLQRQAPFHVGFKTPGMWKKDPFYAATNQLRRAGLSIPGTGGTTSTRLLEVEIIVGRIKDKSEFEALKTMLQAEWTLQDCWLTGVDKEKNIGVYRGQDYLLAGVSEKDLAESIRNLTWFTMERFVPVKIKTVLLDNLPSQSWDFEEESVFKETFPGPIRIPSETKSEFQEISKAIETSQVPAKQDSTRRVPPPLPKGETLVNEGAIFTEGDLEEDLDEIEEDDDATEPLPLLLSVVDDDDIKEPENKLNNDDGGENQHYPFHGVH